MVIEVRNLVKRYKEVLALDHFNLEVAQGEILGLGETGDRTKAGHDSATEQTHGLPQKLHPDDERQAAGASRVLTSRRP